MAEGVWGKLRGVVFGRKSAAPPAHADAELLERTDEFNRNADEYWRSIAAEPLGRRHILNRPLFGRTAPVDLYRVGLLLSELRLGPGLEVLDFGAGSCWLSAFFNRMGCKTISVDVSQAALDLGRELFAMDTRQRPDLAPEFRVYDGRRLPLADASVDRIACFDAFHHVPNQEELLAEMFRVLRPGGRVVLAEPGEGHSHAETSLYEEQVFEVLENDFDVLAVEKRARAAGFSEVGMKPYLEISSGTLSADDYVRIRGEKSMLDPSALRASAALLGALRASFRACAIMVLSKGPEQRDSRSPGLLRAELAFLSPESTLRGLAQTAVQARVRARNVGDTLWRRGTGREPGDVEIGGHLLTPAGRPVTIDVLRAPLPRDVAPGDEVEVPIAVRFPDLPGHYVLRLDPVADEIAWFNQTGSTFLDLPIESVSTEDDAAYRAGLSVTEEPPSLRLPRGSRLELPIRVENEGAATWPLAAELGPGAIRLGAQLLDENGRMLDLDYARASLPEQIPPGAGCDVRIALRLPERAGRYRVKLDVVQEAVAWFEKHGSEPLVIELETTDAVADSRAPGLLRAGLTLVSPTGPARVARGGVVAIRVEAVNLGNTRWLSGDDGAPGSVRLGARVGERDYWRASLPEDVEPGASIEVVGELTAPQETGDWTVTLDLVDEGIAWFGDEGSRPASFALSVTSGDEPGRGAA